MTQQEIFRPDRAVYNRSRKQGWYLTVSRQAQGVAQVQQLQASPRVKVAQQADGGPLHSCCLLFRRGHTPARCMWVLQQQTVLILSNHHAMDCCVRPLHTPVTWTLPHMHMVSLEQG